MGKSTIVLTAEDRTRAAFESVKKNFEQMDRLASKVGIGFGAYFSVEGIRKFVEANIEAERSQNRLTAVINAQGNAAGFTRARLEEMAESLADATQFDDSAFRNGEAELLKFGNIYGDVFERALKVSADLAAFEQEDLSPAISAVGRALQSPVEGLKQLESAIGKIDPAQRRQLETMIRQQRILEAQAKLLDIIEGKVGGAATTMNSGYTKAWNDVSKSYNNLIESAGHAGPAQEAVQGLFNIIKHSLDDIRRMIESGDWYASLMYLLGGMWGKGPNGEALGAQFGVTAQSSMAKHITDLMDQLQELEKMRSQRGFTITDDEGRLYGDGVDEQIESTRKELAALQAEYDRLYAGEKGALPSPGPRIHTPEQESYLEGLRKQLSSAGQDPIFGQLKEAERMGVLGEARPIILGVNAALMAQQTVLDDARQAWQAYQQMENFSLEGQQSIDDLKLRTKLLTAYREDAELATASQEFDNRVVRETLHMTAEQAQAYREIAATIKGPYLEAFQENLDAQRRWQTGFAQSMNEITDYATNTAQQVHDLFTGAFKSMEDALVDFAMTGKLNFRDFANSVIEQILRIQVQQSIIAPLSGALSQQGGAVGAVLGALGIRNSGVGVVETGALTYGPTGSNWVPQVPHYAMGTPYVPTDGLAYLHRGERVVTAAENRGSAGGVNVSYVLNIDSRTDQASIMQAMEMTRRRTINDVQKLIYRGDPRMQG